MTRLGSQLDRVEVETSRLGHVIHWNTMGERVANGHCTKCSLAVTVATSREGLVEMTGEMLERACSSGVASGRKTA